MSRTDIAAPFGTAVTVRYEEAMLRRAVRAFMVRRVFRRWEGWAAAAALAAGAAVCAATGAVFVAGLLAGVLVLGAGTVAAIWQAHLRNTVGKVRAMRPPEAEFSFGPAGLAVASSLGSATLPWSAVRECWQEPGFCMLFTAPAQFITLPTRELPPGLLPTILACIAGQAGAAGRGTG